MQIRGKKTIVVSDSLSLVSCRTGGAPTLAQAPLRGKTETGVSLAPKQRPTTYFSFSLDLEAQVRQEAESKTELGALRINMHD